LQLPFYFKTVLGIVRYLILISDFNLDEYNMIDMDAKKVLEALSEFNRGEFARGDQIHKKTGLLPETINGSIRVLEKSLMVDNPSYSEKLSPYDFYAVTITEFGRQVLEQFG